jgi:hypothetical protein
VLLANAGCSTGYFDDLARVLAAGGLQTISVNMRGAGESRGSLDGITVHDLAADVAGVLEAVDCGPAHTFLDRFQEPWNRHDVDGALALMTDDCVWEVTRGAATGPRDRFVGLRIRVPHPAPGSSIDRPPRMPWTGKLILGWRRWPDIG